MFLETYRITCKLQRFILWNGESPFQRNSLGNRGLPIGIEGRWKIEEFAAAQRAEVSIQMVKAAIDEFERNDFPIEALAQIRKCADVRPLPIPPEPTFREAQEVDEIPKNQRTDKNEFEVEQVNETGIETFRVRLPKKRNREMFASADLMMGANHIRVRCIDGVTRMGRIKGKIKKRVWIREGDTLISGSLEFPGREV